jgi:hypothetical protein
MSTIRVHQIREEYSFRNSVKVYRYTCTCGKKGTYKRWSGDCVRGANAHLRAAGVTGRFLTRMQ